MNKNKKDPLIFNQNFQLLLDIANNTEKIPPHLFNMEIYLCGTVGCMLGHYLLKCCSIENILCHSGEKINYLNNDLNISSLKEWAFIFSGSTIRFLNGGSIRIISETKSDPILAAKRLRKYIYYKLHKREMLGDCSTKEGREKYEVMRKAEGNHNFVQRAKSRSMEFV